MQSWELLPSALLAVQTSVLIAQTSMPGPAEIGSLTSSGILVWYAWHTTNNTIPGLAKTFSETIDKMRDEFREELALQRQEAEEIRRELLGTLVKEREEFRKSLAEERAYFTQLSKERSKKEGDQK